MKMAEIKVQDQGGIPAGISLDLPASIALQIMDKYSSLEEAETCREEDWPDAVDNLTIHGSSAMIMSVLALMRSALEECWAPPGFVDALKRLWTREMKGCGDYSLYQLGRVIAASESENLQLRWESWVKPD